MIYHIYCDESRQTKDRFMVLGGVIIKQLDIPKFNETMQKFRSEEAMFSELKWTKVSNAKLSQYKRFIDYFFALNNTDNIHFHSIVIDNHAVNHKKFNDGDKEKGFYKFYYQLLLHSFGKRYSKNNTEAKFLVYLDERQTQYSLSEFKEILNNGMWKHLNNPSDPFKAIEPRDSKKVDLIQMADVILGAVGFQKNGYSLIAGTSESKKALAKYILSKAGVNHLGYTSYSRVRFSIWNFRLKK